MTILTEQDTITVRFAGDSGDGIQLTGAQLTNTSAVFGNDVHTFPDFPAEIRAPAGTLPGVSGFQICFSSKPVHGPGDTLQALVAMNPAALKTNLQDLEKNGLLIVNENSFTEKELKKAKYTDNPLESDSLAIYRVFAFPITELTLNALKEIKLTHSQASKCKNMFALGIVYWLYSRPMELTLEWIEKKFAHHPHLVSANQAALKAGYNYALTLDLFTERYQVKKAQLPKGTYRQLTGNDAFGLACAAVAIQSERPFLLAGYPITPASAVLQVTSKIAQQVSNMSVFQAEDEIAAMSSVVGSAFGGALGVTVTSGPGFDLKSEALGLAVMTELPCVVIDVQRAGPSTGMPTKTEQSDLLAAMYGRHGESPLPILSPQSPGDCFNILIEAFQIAIKYMTPVIVLSEGYLATSAEPWMIPNLDSLQDLKPNFATENALEGQTSYSPYHNRDSHTLRREWAIPGTKNLMHRIGGLEKDFETGSISYDPKNHHKMVNVRAQKIDNIEVPDVEIIGNPKGKCLVISWGGTYGCLLTAIEELSQENIHDVAMIHLRYLNPLPKNLEKILSAFQKILVAELNLGQLSQLLRAKYLVDAQSFSKVSGKPFLVSELKSKICELLELK